MKNKEFKYIGFTCYFIKRWTPTWLYNDYHLALYSKFLNANACKSFIIGWWSINIWAVNEEWNKQLGLKNE